MNKESYLTVNVYHEDVDIFGVVYNANYLKFMERGRSEWLRTLGFEQKELLEKNYLFVVRSAQLDFIKPARFGDKLSVVTKPVKLGKASVIFKQTIQYENDQQLIYCIGQIKVACVDTSMRPCAIPEELIHGR